MGIHILSRFLFQEFIVGLNIQPIFEHFLCTFGTGYGLEHIRFSSSFNLKSTGSVFQAPRVPAN